MSNVKGYADRRKQADKFNPEIISILKDYFKTEIREASLQEDMVDGVDFWAGDISISVRTRKHKAKAYKEATFRAYAANARGVEEWEKIKGDKIKYFLLCFQNEAESGIDSYFLIDLDEAREFWERTSYCTLEYVDGGFQKQFYSQSVDLLPAPIVAASGGSSYAYS